MDKKLLEYIICPKCKNNNLEKKSNNLICLSCKSNYPIKNGILILIHPKKQKETIALWNAKGEFSKLHAKRVKFDIKGEATTPLTAKALKREVDKSSAILNVGSGSGQYLKEMKGASLIISFDIIPYFVRKTAEKFNSKKYIFLVADATDFPFRKGSFDIVFSSQVIEHLEEKESSKLLRDMISSTKEVVIVDTPNDGNLFIRTLRKIVYKNISMEHHDHHLVHHRLIGKRDLEKFGYETHGSFGYVTRKKFKYSIFWNICDFFVWEMPDLGGNLIGIFRKKY